jgi:hypothetical protein
MASAVLAAQLEEKMNHRQATWLAFALGSLTMLLALWLLGLLR